MVPGYAANCRVVVVHFGQGSGYVAVSALGYNCLKVAAKRYTSTHSLSIFFSQWV